MLPKLKYEAVFLCFGSFIRIEIIADKLKTSNNIFL